MINDAGNKRRGTIIVDSSVLIHLMAPSNKRLLSADDKGSDGVNRFSDWLIALSKHGYDIVISEMTAYQLGQVYRNGASISRVFEHRPVNFSGLHGTAKDNYEFLSAVGRGAYPHIRIAQHPPAADSAAADFLRRLNESQATHLTPGDRRARIMELSRVNTKNFGIMAAADLVAHMPLDDAPLFYLSNHSHGRVVAEEAARRRGIELGQINLKGFLLGLTKNNLFGFNNSQTKVDTLTREIMEAAHSIEQDIDATLRLAPVDGKAEAVHSDFRFMASLNGVREEIETQGTSEVPARSDGSRVAAWAQKFGPTSKWVKPAKPGMGPSKQ
jgi:hypothetical protein